MALLAERTAAQAINFIQVDLVFCRSDANMGPPVWRIQMSLLFHLQNHRREILLLSLVRLPRIDLKGSSRSGHSHANGSREMENQPEILVHQANRKLRAIIALLRSLQFSRVRGSNHCRLRQHVQQAISIKTSLLAECDRFRN